MLKHEGKLTKAALEKLEVQLDRDHFMDLLVQLFIGAEVKSHEEDRILFVPSVLTNSPDDVTPSEVGIGPQEQSLCFVITFEDKHFIPGVFTGMIARLQSTPDWEICTHSISRVRMEFAVGTVGSVILFDHATHISVQMDHHEGQYQAYRDTVIEPLQTCTASSSTPRLPRTLTVGPAVSAGTVPTWSLGRHARGVPLSQVLLKAHTLPN